MRRFVLQLSLCAGFACGAPALAGVGTTSAGVTTTDPNAPSANVQQQSAGFVAANQQLQNGAASGIALPGGVAGGAAPTGQNAAGNADAKGAPTGQSGAQGAAVEHAAPALPAAPPPPPPTYESKMRPINQPATIAAASTPPQPAASAPPVQAPVHVPAPAPPFAARPPAAPVANQNHARPAEKSNAEAALAVPADPGGGRGAAPDGYTFWFGLLIAGALLALAAVTYLRIQRGETPR
ncbi:MAG: hypothetical protein KGI64_11370 [Xanthomonadaceae bacterium]|nr:hypothetical protein [Xanthomonadaceae bacterium]MDE1961932.1 hypothetical protein [Xanthomonadaceae bacterium]MDE2085448.1 hypothetical protein [Xanthomonadaceae bacterium]MDE2256538.1 hypothetical protein [Xanthomonadaceae bacterium]